MLCSSAHRPGLAAALLLLRVVHARWDSSTSARTLGSAGKGVNARTLSELNTGSSYDWSKSTAENHQLRGAPFRPEFAASRERLDYTWHVRYSLRRQEQRDAIQPEPEHEPEPEPEPEPDP